MGHEFCGQIEEVCGPKSNWIEGKRVIAYARIHCAQCALCLRGDTNLCTRRQIFEMDRPGAFAECIAVPQRVLIPWPEGIPGAVAVLTEPLANGINANGVVSCGEKVASGCGPIGLMCILAARRLHGSSVVVCDLIPERLEPARRLGADETVNIALQDLTREAREHWSGSAPEFVIDAVGSAETKLLSLELVEFGGTVVSVGLHEDLIPLNSYFLTLGQKSVAGSYSGSFNDFRQAA